METDINDIRIFTEETKVINVNINQKFEAQMKIIRETRTKTESMKAAQLTKQTEKCEKRTGVLESEHMEQITTGNQKRKY